MYNGYDFYFKDGSDVLTFPITPAELKIKVGSNNKVITLINEGDINILKSPSLIEVEFEARFPMRNYPYSRNPSQFQSYFDKFKELKEEKKPFRFIVVRSTIGGKTGTWDTNLYMALEDFEILENADEGDDVLISFKLKQYKDYGVKTLKTESASSTTTSTSTTSRPTDSAGTDTNKSYTIKSGDTLYALAKSAYGDGSLWTKIYEANKTAIEEDAKKHGDASSSNGHLIHPGLQITIPALKKE